nr:hypothetical protein [Tanacetum cinerariifolium]
MNSVATEQVTLNNSLVDHEKRLKIEKCNTIFAFNKPQREEAYQVTLDVLKLTPSVRFYPTKNLWNFIQKNNFFHLSRNLGILASVICYRQFIGIKCTSLGEHLLLLLTGASLGRQHDLIGSGNHQLKSYGSDTYKTYYDFATGKVIPKPKYVRRSTKEKTDQAPKASPGKRLKVIAKVARSGKKKLPAKGLETLSKVALSEAEQMKITIKKIKTQFHSSQGSGSDDDDQDDDNVDDQDNDDKDDDNADDEDHDGQDDDNEHTELDKYDDDNEHTELDKYGDDFVHPKLSTFDEEEIYEEKLDEEEEGSDQKFHTPSHFESTDDEAYDEVTQGDNVEEEKLDEEKENENEEVNELYNDKTLYKALIDAYEIDKVIHETYGDNVMFKRRQDDEDEDEKHSARYNRGSKRIRSGKEPKSTSAPKEKTSKSTGSSKEGSKSKTSTLAWKEDPRELFNELMDTPLDFLAFLLNWLNVDTLTLELLAGLTFELMKGSYKSLVELEYFLKEVYKATTDQLDWNNHEGQQYLHDLPKPLPLIPNSRGHRVIPFDHFINNDLAYLSDGVSSQTYATTPTKIKATDYGHIKWIEDLVPNTMWSQVPIVYEKHALWGIFHWGRKRKLTNLNIEECLALGVSLRMCTRSIVIKRHVEDLQLGVKSYQKNLNLTNPDTYRSDLKRNAPYTAYSNPRGFIYQNQDKKNRLMHVDELYKFSDGTHNDVWSALDDTLKKIRMKYLPQTI